MMRTFLAKLGSEFFYDPQLQGEIWIAPPVGRGDTIVIPMFDLMQFCSHVAQVPEKGSEKETDELLKILDSCGVLDPNQPREETRKKLHERLHRHS